MAKIHFGTAECQAFVVLVLTICKRQLFPDISGWRCVIIAQQFIR